MKHKVLMTIFISSVTTLLFGQNFGSVGTQWHYSEHGGGMAPPNSEYLHLNSVEDTVINGITTHKIVRNYYKFSGDTVKLPSLYVYEQADTAFMYNFQKARFLSIYIFNGSKGDTLTLDFPEPLSGTTDSTYRLVIDTVETVTVDGVSLKKYRTYALDEFNFFGDGYFMDKIGGLDWFFPRAYIIPEAGGPIRCYSDSQIDTNFQSVDCDHRLVSSMNEFENGLSINVFPNPFQNEFKVQTDQPVGRVELSDLTGKRIMTTNQLKLDCGSIRNGIYILTVYFKSGQIVDKKVVKNSL